MSTLTSSAINKSGKTVAPKAVARRRPNAPRAAPLPPPPNDGEEVRDPETVTKTNEADAATTKRSAQTDDRVSDAHREATQGPEVEAHSEPNPGAEKPLPALPTGHEAREPSAPATQDRYTEPSNVTPEPQSQAYAHNPAKDLIVAPSAPPRTQEATADPGDIVNDAPGANNTQVENIINSQSPVLPSEPQVASPQSQPKSTSSTVPLRQPGPQIAGVKRKRKVPGTVASEKEAPDAGSQIRESVEAQDNPLIESAQDGVTNAAAAITKATTKSRRGKRKNTAVADSEEQTSGTGDGSASHGKKTPKVRRKPKSAVRVVEDDGQGGGEDTTANGDEAAKGEAVIVQQPKKRKRRKAAEAQQGSQDDAEEAIEDPELHEIDANVTTMFDLTRDRGLGKTSEREVKMSNIDWTEVSRKRRETVPLEGTRKGDAEKATGDGTPAEGTERTESPPRPNLSRVGPQLRIVNGEIQVDEASLHVDRQAQAALNAANLQITEDGDLTRRVNRMTWINDKKRDVAERVPIFKMKSDPWSLDETQRFYEALRMFGTDFFIISKMFQPKTRRQIKLKFIREERLFPERINAALAGENVPMDLEAFAEATGMEMDSFKDPREIEEELRQEGEEQRGEIERKKKETAEAQQQREIQVAAREKEREERDAQKQAQKNERNAIRARKRRGQFGTGAL